VGVVRVVVVLVLERVFVVGGEVVAATTRVLAGRGRDLDQETFFFVVCDRCQCAEPKKSQPAQRR
jgi:hypothetical protein